MIDLTTLEPTNEIYPPRLVVYGPEGVGKTTFAASAPNPVFADIEGGLKGIKAAKQRIHTWPEMIAMMNALRDQPHQFKTLVIDTMDWLQHIVFKTVAASNKVSNITDVPYNKGFNQAEDFFKALTDRMTELQEKRNMINIVLAHAQVKRFDDPLGPGYDKYKLDLDKRLEPYITEWADGILFMREKSITTSEKGGFTGEIRKAVGTGIYMHATGGPAYIAKNRAMLSLPKEFQITKANPWGDFVAQVGKGE